MPLGMGPYDYIDEIISEYVFNRIGMSRPIAAQLVMLAAKNISVALCGKVPE